MELQVGVKAFLQNKDGKYLLLKRSAKEYGNVAGMWDIVGGRIIPGTPLIENLKREIKEETQFVLKVEPKLIDATDILRVPGRHVVRLTYLSKVEGEPILQEDEIEQYRWLTIDEIKYFPDLDIYTKDLLDRIKIK